MPGLGRLRCQFLTFASYFHQTKFGSATAAGCVTTHDAARLAFEDHSASLLASAAQGLSAGSGDATLRERYRRSNTSQEGKGRGEVYESRPLTRELEAPAVAGDQPDGGGGKEAAELDGDALKLTILEPCTWLRHGEKSLERPSLKLLEGVSAALGRCCGCFDNAERSCDRVVGRLGQEDLPGCEDEVSYLAAISTETEPWDYQENAFLAHRRPFRESDAILVTASLMIQGSSRPGRSRRSGRADFASALQ